MAGPPTVPEAAARGDATTGSLSHGLAILDLFSGERRELGVGEIALRLGLHKSSVSRLAATLSAAGYLRRTDRPGRYRLGQKVLRLAAFVDALRLEDAGLSVVRPLVERLGETGHLAVLDGHEVVTVAVVDGWRNMRMQSWVGKRSPAHATAIGKTLLAELPESEVRRLYRGVRLEVRTPATITTIRGLVSHLADVKATGVAYDDEEFEIGLRCVAAPVRDRDGKVVAAVGISGPAVRLSGSALADVSYQLRAAGAEISAVLGGPITA